MCAIFSWFGPMTNPVLRRLYQEARNYGPHSAGLAYIDEDGLNVFKKAVDPLVFVRNHNHRIERAARYSVGFGHVRYATHGSVIDENAHPFTYKDIVYGHNGVISNYRQLADAKGLGSIVVDSQCLGPLIEDHELGRAQGSTAVVWLQQGRLFVYRHCQNLVAAHCLLHGQPLFLVASRPAIIKNCEAVDGFKVLNFVELNEYVAYEVTAQGLHHMWTTATVGRETRTTCSVQTTPSRLRPATVSFYQAGADADEGEDEDEDEDDGLDPMTTVEFQVQSRPEAAAQNLTAVYNLFILSRPQGDVTVYSNDLEQLYEAVSEFISAEARDVALTGARKDEGETEWTTTPLARWRTDSEPTFSDKNLRCLAESVAS